MTEPGWLIIADDLTGAADAGVAFARRGYPTEVVWQERLPEAGTTVVACDVNSRGLSAASAAERHRAAVHRLLIPGLLTPARALFKKIDSTLRGQPAAEVAALCAALRELQRPAFAICAPANPAMGRVTRDGRVLVHGRPLEQSETWMSQHSYENADLAAIFATAGLDALKLSLAQIRDSAASLSHALNAARATSNVVICDAETHDDLARIVAAARALPEQGFYVGTAGLAQALAESLPGTASLAPALKATKRGILVAVGSRASISRAAALRLATHLDTRTVRVEPAGAYDGPSQAMFAMSLGARMHRGEVAVVLLDGPEPRESGLDSAYLRFFAETLTFALQQMGALVVTGGETASALLAQARVDGIRLLDEIEPGLALGVTCGDIEVPIVTKPGAFGDEESLIRCVERLRQLGRPE
jgi:uncharacterized protein YgbK (DUF1537 family)